MKEGNEVETEGKREIRMRELVFLKDALTRDQAMPFIGLWR